jgi:hypothetical protein
MAKATRSRIRNKYSGAGTEGAMDLPSGAGRTRMESGWRRMTQNKMRKSRGIPKGEVKAGSQTRAKVGGNRPQILKDLDRIKARGRGKSSRVEKDIFEPLPTVRPAQSPRSRTSTPKTGGKLAAAGTALAVGAGIGAALGGGKSKKTTSAIPAKNRAKKSASSKRENYLNTVSSKPVAKKASGSSKPAPSAMNRRENSLNMSKPKKSTVSSKPNTSVKKKMGDSALRGTSRTPDSERAVKTVKTKGGDYKVYKKDSAAAKSFRQAYADAVKERKKLGLKAGKHIFTWEGRKYTA